MIRLFQITFCRPNPALVCLAIALACVAFLSAYVLGCGGAPAEPAASLTDFVIEMGRVECEHAAECQMDGGPRVTCLGQPLDPHDPNLFSINGDSIFTAAQLLACGDKLAALPCGSQTYLDAVGFEGFWARENCVHN